MHKKTYRYLGLKAERASKQRKEKIAISEHKKYVAHCQETSIS